MSDPLGRLAAHAAAPYEAPRVTTNDLAKFWRDQYRYEAKSLGTADLRDEHITAALDLEHTPVNSEERRVRLTEKISAFGDELARRET